MIVACEKQDDKNTKNFEVLFEKAKKEIKKESIKKIHRCASCPKLKYISKRKKDQDKNSNSSLILNVDNSLDENSKKEEDDKINIPLINNLRISNKKKICNNSTNNLNNLPSNKIKNSNASTSSFGRNFILKSDVCKSTISNYYNRYHEEMSNPWASYYGMDKKTVPNDYLLFVKKTKKENENDFGDFLQKGDGYLNKNKKKIMISTNIDDEENVKYIDGCEEEEDEEVDGVEDPDIGSNMFDSVYNNGILKSIINPRDSYGTGTNIGSTNNSGNIQYDPNPQVPNNNISINNNIINYNISNTNQYYNQQYNPQMVNKPTLPIRQNQMYPPMTNQMNQIPPVMPNNMYYNNPQMKTFPNQQPMLYPNQPYSNYSDASLAQISPFLIKEQTGCRFIQEKVQSSPLFANTLLFPFLLKANCTAELVCDQFGNYLFQVLLDVLSEENLSNFIIQITPTIYQICISPHGTRVMQKLIEKLTTSVFLLNKLSFALANSNLIDIMKDPYGNHIIQKFLICIHDPMKNGFIIDTVVNNFLNITNSKHGVCVVQKCVSEGTKEQKEKVLSLITSNIYEILTDQFGNYVIQYLLTSTDVNLLEIDGILQYILDNIFAICKMKFSANVIEKCFENSTEEIKSKIIISMLRKNNYLIELLMDQYGNYVVQKALLVTKGDLYMKMLTIISKGINELKQAAFGNKLIVKLINTHQELGNMIANSQGSFQSSAPKHYHNNNQGHYGGYNKRGNRNNNIYK